MTIIQPQSAETNLVGTIVNENVETDDLVIYASFMDKKTGEARTPRPETKIFVIDKDDSKFEIIFADSHTTTDGVTTIVVNTMGRGLNKYGNLSGSAIGTRHTIGKEIGVADIHTYVEIINDIIRGTNATGSNIFRVGKEDNGDVTLYFQKDDEAIPFIRYDVSENKLVYSNNGVDTLDVGGGTGTITGGEGIGIEAGVVNVEGAIQVDDEDSAGYLEDKLTGENGVEIETVGSTDKDINIKLNDTLKANLDTLTDGSVADDLHTHSALGVITATAGEDIDGSTTPKACFISSGDVDVSTEITIQNTSSGGTYVLNNTLKRLSQSITVGDTVFGLKNLTVYWQRFGSSSTLNLRLEVFAVDANDKPTGSALQTINVTTSGPSSSGSSVFTGILLLPNTKYCFVISSTQADGTNYYNIFTDLTGAYADGKFHYSEDSGANYVLSATDLKFAFVGYGGYEEGKIYMSKSDNVYRNFFDFFVTEAVTKGNSITFEDKKEVDGFTGLTPNKFYEITSTNGAVALATKQDMFVAVSATKLNVMRKTTMFFAQDSDSCGTSGCTVELQINFSKRHNLIKYASGSPYFEPMTYTYARGLIATSWVDAYCRHIANYGGTSGAKLQAYSQSN